MPSATEPDCGLCDSIQKAGTIKKRLIVCCDGTFTASNTGRETNPSNISLLSRTIANVGIDPNDPKHEKIPQVVFYQSGIGTGAMSLTTKVMQGGFGGGLNEKVVEAFTFLANNYGPNDEIFLFGFSRGAYTARSIAGLICQVGLLTPGMMDYFDEIYNEYKRRGDAKSFEDTEWAKAEAVRGELGLDDTMYPGEKMSRIEYIRKWAHLHVKIKVVGVFDTVGSLGISGRVDQPGTDLDFHSTTLHPKIENAFHALALDESRGNFPPTLFYLDEACREAGVNLRQCWFPGYHGDIGGDAIPLLDTNSMNEITFAWMIDQLERAQLLQFDKTALKYPILSRLENLDANTVTSFPPLTPEQVHKRRIQWSDGRLMPTDNLFWQAASLLSTLRFSYRREPGTYYAKDGGSQIDYEHFKEEIHPTVYHRMLSRPHGWAAYKPEALKGWKRVADGPGRGFSWVKEIRKGWLGVGEKEVVKIQEYRIERLEERDTKGYEHWTGSLERVLAPKEYLVYLDQAWEV
ncbi:hypothetical protein M409DRAFT_37029 [Zasmidium cellare ATCC 36951]|uniref:T6SS Phospholipase effector Tle1-like catalytic domain-containing protein n=1 Tax=Zasmidium cellare ATCC 36951 TaxID=1080233 RepID=A0A6A6CCB3_ZASCE|nr:uncharacterized protein M409DRAFT_37029 [Zasmidium cellare ATCC 36951]KAF2164695.1 hypothetical protein M409DRAFT_37029 [Zasmidium cellare ATCC 36951]